MLHAKPLHTAANSINVHGLGIAEHHAIMARIGVQPEAFHAGGPDLFGPSFGNHPQDTACIPNTPQVNIRGVTCYTTPRFPFSRGYERRDADIT